MGRSFERVCLARFFLALAGFFDMQPNSQAAEERALVLFERPLFTEFIFDTSYSVSGICESHVHMGRTRPSRCLCVVRAKGSHGPAEAADPVGILVVVVIVVIVVVDVASEEICEFHRTVLIFNQKSDC